MTLLIGRDLCRREDSRSRHRETGPDRPDGSLRHPPWLQGHQRNGTWAGTTPAGVEAARSPRTATCVRIISHHRQSRWYEEGPLKGPSDEAQFTSVPIRAEALLLTIGPPAPVVPSSHSLGDPLHVGSTRPLRTWPSSYPSVPSSMGAVSNHAGNGRACRSLTARGGGFHRNQLQVAGRDFRVLLALPELVDDERVLRVPQQLRPSPVPAPRARVSPNRLGCGPIPPPRGPASALCFAASTFLRCSSEIDSFSPLGGRSYDGSTA